MIKPPARKILRVVDIKNNWLLRPVDRDEIDRVDPARLCRGPAIVYVPGPEGTVQEYWPTPAPGYDYEMYKIVLGF